MGCGPCRGWYPCASLKTAFKPLEKVEWAPTEPPGREPNFVDRFNFWRNSSLGVSLWIGALYIVLTAHAEYESMQQVRGKLSNFPSLVRNYFKIFVWAEFACEVLAEIATLATMILLFYSWKERKSFDKSSELMRHAWISNIVGPFAVFLLVPLAWFFKSSDFRRDVCTAVSGGFANDEVIRTVFMEAAEYVGERGLARAVGPHYPPTPKLGRPGFTESPVARWCSNNERDWSMRLFGQSWVKLSNQRVGDGSELHLPDYWPGSYPGVIPYSLSLILVSAGVPESRDFAFCDNPNLIQEGDMQHVEHNLQHARRRSDSLMQNQELGRSIHTKHGLERQVLTTDADETPSEFTPWRFLQAADEVDSALLATHVPDSFMKGEVDALEVDTQPYLRRYLRHEKHGRRPSKAFERLEDRALQVTDLTQQIAKEVNATVGAQGSLLEVASDADPVEKKPLLNRMHLQYICTVEKLAATWVKAITYVDVITHTSVGMYCSFAHSLPMVAMVLGIVDGVASGAKNVKMIMKGATMPGYLLTLVVIVTLPAILLVFTFLAQFAGTPLCSMGFCLLAAWRCVDVYIGTLCITIKSRKKLEEKVKKWEKKKLGCLVGAVFFFILQALYKAFQNRNKVDIGIDFTGFKGIIKAKITNKYALAQAFCKFLYVRITTKLVVSNFILEAVFDTADDDLKVDHEGSAEILEAWGMLTGRKIEKRKKKKKKRKKHDSDSSDNESKKGKTSLPSTPKISTPKIGTPKIPGVVLVAGSEVTSTIGSGASLAAAAISPKFDQMKEKAGQTKKKLKSAAAKPIGVSGWFSSLMGGGKQKNNETEDDEGEGEEGESEEEDEEGEQQPPAPPPASTEEFLGDTAPTSPSGGSPSRRLTRHATPTVVLSTTGDSAASSRPRAQTDGGSPRNSPRSQPQKPSGIGSGSTNRPRALTEVGDGSPSRPHSREASPAGPPVLQRTLSPQGGPRATAKAAGSRPHSREASPAGPPVLQRTLSPQAARDAGSRPHSREASPAGPPVLQRTLSPQGSPRATAKAAGTDHSPARSPQRQESEGSTRPPPRDKKLKKHLSTRLTLPGEFPLQPHLERATTDPQESQAKPPSLSRAVTGPAPPPAKATAGMPRSREGSPAVPPAPKAKTGSVAPGVSPAGSRPHSREPSPAGPTLDRGRSPASSPRSQPQIPKASPKATAGKSPARSPQMQRQVSPTSTEGSPLPSPRSSPKAPAKAVTTMIPRPSEAKAPAGAKKRQS